MEMTKNQGLERVPPTGEGLAEGSTGLDTYAGKVQVQWGAEPSGALGAFGR